MFVQKSALENFVAATKSTADDQALTKTQREGYSYQKSGRENADVISGSKTLIE